MRLTPRPCGIGGALPARTRGTHYSRRSRPALQQDAEQRGAHDVARAASIETPLRVPLSQARIIDDWIGRNSRKYPNLKISVGILYQSKGNAPRLSPKLAPRYVVYVLQVGAPFKRFAIGTRARELGKADAEAVRKELDR